MRFQMWSETKLKAKEKKGNFWPIFPYFSIHFPRKVRVVANFGMSLSNNQKSFFNSVKSSWKCIIGIFKIPQNLIFYLAPPPPVPLNCGMKSFQCAFTWLLKWKKKIFIAHNKTYQTLSTYISISINKKEYIKWRMTYRY